MKNNKLDQEIILERRLGGRMGTYNNGGYCECLEENVRRKFFWLQCHASRNAKKGGNCVMEWVIAYLMFAGKEAHLLFQFIKLRKTKRNALNTEE